MIIILLDYFRNAHQLGFFVCIYRLQYMNRPKKRVILCELQLDLLSMLENEKNLILFTRTSIKLAKHLFRSCGKSTKGLKLGASPK